MWSLDEAIEGEQLKDLPKVP